MDIWYTLSVAYQIVILLLLLQSRVHNYKYTRLHMQCNTTYVILLPLSTLDCSDSASVFIFSFLITFRYIESAFSNVLDTNQNLESNSTSISGSFLTLNFTRPIISPDKTQDLDLNVCRYVIYIYGGTVDSFTMPTFTLSNAPTGFGIFQLCLQNCQGMSMIADCLLILML